jgi:hypothetical protein
MALELYAEGKNSDNGPELRVKTIIEARLADQNRIICQAAGPPLEHGQNPNGWVLMLGGDEAAYWHWNCVWFRLNPSDTYTLTIRIRDVDPNTPKINLIPTIRGGEPDLP